MGTIFAFGTQFIFINLWFLFYSCCIQVTVIFLHHHSKWFIKLYCPSDVTKTFLLVTCWEAKKIITGERKQKSMCNRCGWNIEGGITWTVFQLLFFSAQDILLKLFSCPLVIAFCTSPLTHAKLDLTPRNLFSTRLVMWHRAMHHITNHAHKVTVDLNITKT